MPLACLTTLCRCPPLTCLAFRGLGTGKTTLRFRVLLESPLPVNIVYPVVLCAPIAVARKLHFCFYLLFHNFPWDAGVEMNHANPTRQRGSRQSRLANALASASG
jgi:hypothetical protein